MKSEQRMLQKRSIPPAPLIKGGAGKAHAW